MPYRCATAIVVLALTMPVVSQTPPPQKPSFEVQSSRPVVQSKLLFYSDGQFAYKLTIQESGGGAALQWVVPQHQSFAILGTLRDGSLLRDTNPRTWNGEITLRLYGEDEYFTRNWKNVTIVMERLPQ